ncbi:MAG: hypothetical protein IPJ37_05025 [Bacteroidales bacterium]|nr:hypothetical protein [Bacteroidales bacterium]
MPVTDKNVKQVSQSEEKTFFTLEGPWNVSFDTVWGGPDHIVFNELADWSERPEEGIRYYSGQAVYTKSFDLPENQSINTELDYFLDLGVLKNLGRVKVNGHDLGILWTAPWQVNITGLLKEKEISWRLRLSICG